MNAIRRVAALALTALACLAAPATAQIALPFGSAGTANPVMSSKDWEATVAAIGFDAQQRQVADALFNDAQDRMFAAKRRAGDELAKLGPAADDDRSLAAEAQARRTLAQSVQAEIDGLFAGLAPVVRDGQRAAVDREAGAAKRRAVRAMLGPAASGGAVAWDMERVIDACRLSPEAREAALAQLAPYRQRVAARLQKLLDEEISRPRKSARDGKPMPAADSPEFQAMMRQLSRFSESQAAAREAKQDLAAAHREALVAIAPALAPDDLRKVQDTALSRIWPRTGMDLESPAKAIDQLLAKRASAEDRAPVEQLRDAWRARWWPASLRMAESEDGMAGIMMIAGGDAKDSERKARTAFDESRTDRRDADRDAWKALAAVDPERREFYESRAKGDRRGDGMSMIGGADGDAMPAGVTISTTAVAAGDDAPQQDAVIEAAPVVGAVTVMVAGVGAEGAEGEPADTMVFSSDTLDMEGGIGLVMDGGAGDPIVFGDRYGDGMGSDSAFAGIELDATGIGEAAATGGLPGRMSPERIRDAARTLGADPDASAVRALLDDYDAAADAVRASVPGVRGAKPGGTERFAAADAAEVAATLAKALPALAAADDALLAGLGAVGGADEPAVSAVRAERAAQRLWSARHDMTPFGSAEPTVVGKVFLGGCVGAPGIPEADRAAARAAWADWAPSMRAAAERAFATDREVAPELGAIQASWRERFAEVRGNGANVAQEIDMGQAKRQGELVERLADASAELTRTSLAGRRAVLDRLSPEGKAAFDAAWLRAAAPAVYGDRKDAMAALDTAYGLESLSDGQRSQVNALRGEHAARHRELCDRLATAYVASRGGAEAGLFPGQQDTERTIADLRFERAELNARTLRRLRAALTPEQAAAIPSLSPATTRPGPAPASP
jgi:hypothetical protein